MMLPMLLPATPPIARPASRSALITPTCAKPRAPPELSASPTLNGEGAGLWFSTVAALVARAALLQRGDGQFFDDRDDAGHARGDLLGELAVVEGLDLAPQVDGAVADDHGDQQIGGRGIGAQRLDH